MKLHRFFFLSLFLLLVCTAVHAQYKWDSPLEQGFPVVRGQAFQDELKGTYVRLPQRAEANVRKAVWNLSQNSAGLSIVFRSNSPEIKVRYTVKSRLSMPHMPSTGVSGVDLYGTDGNGRLRWCKGNYAFNDTITYTFGGLSYETNPDKGYEYQLFLPLYNTVSWMSIGVPTDKTLEFLPVSQEKPIVIYGTSIAQGACASRPGMAWGNIVNRTLQHPIINLGFSGNGQLEPALFDLLSEIDTKLYIIDCMPNMTGKERTSVIYERVLAGVKKLRAKSKAPILLVEHDGYTNEFSSKSTQASYQATNVELKKAYETLKKENIADLYYLTKEELGLSMDSMVDGVHATDLGMQQYADSYTRKIKEILHEENKPLSTCTPCKQQRDFYNWNERHEEVLKLNKENAPEILMIGNSITHFWGGEPICSSRQVGKESWDKLFKGKKVRNLGFGWDRTENVLWRIYHGELDGYQAKKIFMLIGTNNMQSDTDEHIVEGVSEIVKAIKQRQPQAQVYIMGILPRKGMEKRVKLLNGKLEKLIKEAGVSYVNVGQYLIGKDQLIDASFFMGDGLHLNEKGYARWAQALEKLVK